MRLCSVIVALLIAGQAQAFFNDQGLEVIRRAAEPQTPGSKAEAVLKARLIDSDGEPFTDLNPIPVEASVTMPAGLATSAKQDIGNASLGSIDNKLPSTLGQKTSANSLACVLASDQSAIPVTGTFWQTTQPISAAALPLPAGAATSALQTAGNTSLSSIDSKTPALGQALMAGSVPVAIASNQSAIPASQSGTWTTGRTWSLLNTTDSVNIGNFPSTFGVTQSTSPWVTSRNWNLSFAADKADVSGSSVSISNFPADTDAGTPGAANPSTAVQVAGTDGANLRVLSTDTTGKINVNNISGTVSLPTGAATSALQTAGNSLLTTIATNTGAQATDFVQTGTITASGQTVSITGQGVYTVTANVTGTWVGTLVFEGQMADNNWVQIPANVIATTFPWVSISQSTVNGAFAITGGGYLNVRVRATAWTSGTASIGLDGSLSQQTVIANSFTPISPTYSACAGSLGVAANPTDVFTITGSATKTVLIQKIKLSGTQQNAGSADFIFIRRSTANTGGTSTTITAGQHDSNDAAPTATVRAYTANPTLGTAAGNIRFSSVFIPSKSGTGGSPTLFPFGDIPNESPIVLRGTSQVLAINMNSVTMSNSSLDFCVQWKEQ
jgi:hypothetical protein